MSQQATAPFGTYTYALIYYTMILNAQLEQILMTLAYHDAQIHILEIGVKPSMADEIKEAVWVVQTYFNLSIRSQLHLILSRIST